jgi:putative polysaccharide biosynthesis protein
MTADKTAMAAGWFTGHPITGARVAGRLIPFWSEMRALALQAHRVHSDRFIVGWDVACTPEGPFLLEGNSYPDVEFPQRMDQRSIGRSPMGPPLFHYLTQVAVQRAAARRR